MIFVNGRNFTKKELQQRLDKMNISYENDRPQKEYYIQLYNNAVKDQSKRKHIIDDSDSNNKHFKFKRERTLPLKERDDAIVKNESIEIIKQQTKQKKYVDYTTLMYLGSVVLASKRNEIKETQSEFGNNIEGKEKTHKISLDNFLNDKNPLDLLEILEYDIDDDEMKNETISVLKENGYIINSRDFQRFDDYRKKSFKRSNKML